MMGSYSYPYGCPCSTPPYAHPHASAPGSPGYGSNFASNLGFDPNPPIHRGSGPIPIPIPGFGQASYPFDGTIYQKGPYLDW